MRDQDKSNSMMERKTLLALNGGVKWTMDFKNGSCTMEKKCLNIKGFILPAYVVMMALNDFDGFNNQQIFIRLKERDVEYQEHTPKDSNIPNLKHV